MASDLNTLKKYQEEQAGEMKLLTTKCKCLVGRLFGHKIEIVYETDTEYYSAPEKIALMETEFLYGTVTHKSNYISPVTQPKKETKVLKGFLCKRCGLFTENVLKL